MLRVLAAVATFVTSLTLVGVPAHADEVEDDGTKVRGKYSVFRHGSVKKRVSHKNMVLYRGKWVTIKNLTAVIDACVKAGGKDCDTMDVWRVGGRSVALEPIAVRLATELKLPIPTPTFGPDPSVNEWKMLTVGFPIWLWTEGSRTLTDIASAEGFTFTLTARLRSTIFTMGEGRTVTCTLMSRYSNAVKPGAPSPDCGYIYRVPSLPKGHYTVTATAHWDVAWSVAGMSGTLPVSRTASRQIRIGELSALNR